VPHAQFWESNKLPAPGTSAGKYAARDPAFVSAVNRLTAYFGGSGRGPGPRLMARAAIYQQLSQQATAMAYQDMYRLLCWIAMGMVACAFLLSTNRPGRS
jgi:DHA2 family multidrug resistance protein